MYKLFLLIIILSFNYVSGQNITYLYDNTGNRLNKSIVGNIPTLILSGDSSICIGSSTTITASGGISFLWNTGDTTASITKTPAVNTLYIVTATGTNGCTSQQSFQVSVNPLPITSNITGNLVSEINVSETYNVINTAGSVYNWTAIGGNVVSGAGTNEINILWNSIGTDTVEVVETNSFGCSGATVILPISVIVDVKEINQSNNTLNIYPNPSNGNTILNFIISESGYVNLAIFNDLGKCITLLENNSFSPGQYNFQLDKVQLSEGVYYACLKLNAQLLLKKFIIIK